MDLIFAYIDPGSGSLVIQALIAGLVAVPLFFRRQIARAIHTLRGGRDTTTQVAGGQDEPDADA